MLIIHGTRLSLSYRSSFIWMTTRQTELQFVTFLPPGKAEGKIGILIYMAKTLFWWTLKLEPETVISESLWSALGQQEYLGLDYNLPCWPPPYPVLQIVPSFCGLALTKFLSNPHTTQLLLLFSLSELGIHPKGVQWLSASQNVLLNCIYFKKTW